MQEYWFLRKIIIEIDIGISVQTRIWLDVVISLKMSHGFRIRELYGLDSIVYIQMINPYIDYNNWY